MKRMISNSTISVAMCTYNGARFLPQQLESIAKQFRLPDELVICDDGSTDCTAEIVRTFSRSVTFPVRFAINNKNLGTTKNFERAICLCEGSIVALADQDDVWHQHKLERIDHVFRGSEATVGLFSDANLIDSESRPLNVRLWESFLFKPREQRLFDEGSGLSVLLRHQVVTGATLAFRKNLVQVLIPFEDIHDKWIGFLLAASGRLEALSEPLMQYRRHTAQQIGTGPMNLLERISWMKGNNASFYQSEIERFGRLHSRLEQQKAKVQHAEFAQREIENAISHLKRRLCLPPRGIARVPRIIRDVLSGSYQRYSGGWKSVVKDLVHQPCTY
jgi:glycosyltransferase involved in cell wall biosynthesis